MYVKIVNSQVDFLSLKKDIFSLIDSQNLSEYDQISLTSITGDNDWLCSVGKITDLPFKERFYSTINKACIGTSIETLIKQYSNYYRWRLMKIKPRRTYSVHKDGLGVSNNIRLHVPITTNPDCFLCFYEDLPSSGKTIQVHYEHLSTGNVYEVNTTNFHTAVNYGTIDRYHIVGVRYVL